MNFNEYEDAVKKAAQEKTATFHSELKTLIDTYKRIGDNLQKSVDSFAKQQSTRKFVKNALGDALCCLTKVADKFNISLEDVAQNNYAKQVYYRQVGKERK